MPKVYIGRSLLADSQYASPHSSRPPSVTYLASSLPFLISVAPASYVLLTLDSPPSTSKRPPPFFLLSDLLSPHSPNNFHFVTQKSVLLTTPVESFRATHYVFALHTLVCFVACASGLAVKPYVSATHSSGFVLRPDRYPLSNALRLRIRYY